MSGLETACQSSKVAPSLWLVIAEERCAAKCGKRVVMNMVRPQGPSLIAQEATVAVRGSVKSFEKSRLRETAEVEIAASEEGLSCKGKQRRAAKKTSELTVLDPLSSCVEVEEERFGLRSKSWDFGLNKLGSLVKSFLRAEMKLAGS